MRRLINWSEIKNFNVENMFNIKPEKERIINNKKGGTNSKEMSRVKQK